jgi:hypothetical protein
MHPSMSEFLSNKDDPIYFHMLFSTMNAELSEYFDVRPWVRAIVEWLPNLRDVVSDRVKTRDSSIQQMFKAPPHLND